MKTLVAAIVGLVLGAAVGGGYYYKQFDDVNKSLTAAISLRTTLRCIRIICIVIFAVVAGWLIYAVFAFRVKPGDDTDGPPIHGHSGLEVAWTAVPAMLVIAIGVVTAVVLSRNADAGPNPLHIKVFAQQFAWRFQYPDDGDFMSNELVMPLDRTIQFEMTSADVIHSFWIPEMGQKQDLLPGIETKIVITPTKLGSYTLVCTELCGAGHATMRGPARVVSTAEFTSWTKKQSEASSGGAGAAAPDGAKLFAAGIGCSVHYIPLHLHPYWRDRYGLTPAQFPHSQRAYERMVLICHTSAQERIAWFLLEMSKRSGGADSFMLPMTRADIADYLGLAIETVSRVLTQFKVAGTISVHVINRITLADREALEAAAGEA